MWFHIVFVTFHCFDLLMEKMDDYQIKKHRTEWIKGLYNIKESWILVYNRSTFFAGMNTTQRSESINAYYNNLR